MNDLEQNNMLQPLVDEIETTVSNAKKELAEKVNSVITQTYWTIGKYIVEFEQDGNVKAAYGSKLLTTLSHQLTLRLGRGYSRPNLNNMRKFYLCYENCQTVSDKLTWSHICELIKIDDELERSFYEKECYKEKWDVRTLRRQMDSALFLRLATSRDKEGILALANEGITYDKPEDIIKDTYTLQSTLEQQRAEAELAEQKRDELILYLAHDLKTPLTSVIGYLSILDENKGMNREQREKCIRVGLDKAMRLEKLINEFFEITRFRQSEITLSKTNIDLHYMLIQLVDEFTPQLQASHVEVEILMAEDVQIRGDANYLARAFQNVLKNAVAYSDRGSVITISVYYQKENAIINVSNTGDTILPEQQAHIFEKFYRADEARQGNTGGAGLGLAIAKNIIVLHGGTIAVESQERKTTFTITLPDAKIQL